LESNIFKCGECGREFELDYQLDLHMQYFHKFPTAFKCEKCGREFGLKEQLDIHLAEYLHETNDKPTNQYSAAKLNEQPRKLY